MSLDTLNHDVHVNGALSAKTFVPPAGCISDASVAAGAGIATTKVRHRHQKSYAQESATTAASEARFLHLVKGATASVVNFRAGVIVANIGAATITFDLKKNGSTILTAVITTNSGTAIRTAVEAAIASASLVAGDVLEVTIVATAGGGTIGKGAWADLVIDEDAA